MGGWIVWELSGFGCEVEALKLCINHSSHSARGDGTYLGYIQFTTSAFVRYDHTLLNTSDPVRSPVIKQQRDSLVVQWVTMRESGLLYFCIFCSASGYHPR